MPRATDKRGFGFITNAQKDHRAGAIVNSKSSIVNGKRSSSAGFWLSFAHPVTIVPIPVPAAVFKKLLLFMFI